MQLCLCNQRFLINFTELLHFRSEHSGDAVLFILQSQDHTIYIRNRMGQKCEGNCGLWVLHVILKKTYPENLKKIVGAVWELPAR